MRSAAGLALAEELDPEKLLMESVHSSLGVLGKATRNVFYSLLYIDYNIQPEDLARNLPALRACLQSVLGETSLAIERMICKRMSFLLHLKPEVEDFEQLDYLIWGKERAQVWNPENFESNNELPGNPVAEDFDR